MENTMAKDGTNRGGARPGAGRPRKNPDGTTEHASFTAEQLKAFVDSPYVASVSSKSVSYTKAFKEIVWKEYCNGIDPVEIFANHGFDTEVLGRSRIMGFIKMLREAKEKGLNFTEGSAPYPTDAEKKYTFPTPPKLPKRGRPPVMSDSEISKLANTVAYLSQEVAFIKKIILSEMEEK
jgi:hypothetical protein